MAKSKNKKFHDKIKGEEGFIRANRGLIQNIITELGLGETHTSALNGYAHQVTTVKPEKMADVVALAKHMRKREAVAKRNGAKVRKAQRNRGHYSQAGLVSVWNAIRMFDNDYKCKTEQAIQVWINQNPEYFKLSSKERVEKLCAVFNKMKAHVLASIKPDWIGENNPNQFNINNYGTKGGSSISNVGYL